MEDGRTSGETTYVVVRGPPVGPQQRATEVQSVHVPCWRARSQDKIQAVSRSYEQAKVSLISRIMRAKYWEIVNSVRRGMRTLIPPSMMLYTYYHRRCCHKYLSTENVGKDHEIPFEDV